MGQPSMLNCKQLYFYSVMSQLLIPDKVCPFVRPSEVYIYTDYIFIFMVPSTFLYFIFSLRSPIGWLSFIRSDFPKQICKANPQCCDFTETSQDVLIFHIFNKFVGFHLMFQIKQELYRGGIKELFLDKLRVEGAMWRHNSQRKPWAYQ